MKIARCFTCAALPALRSRHARLWAGRARRFENNDLHGNDRPADESSSVRRVFESWQKFHDVGVHVGMTHP